MAAQLYRRAIRLQRTQQTVVAEIEDDFHHFRVRLRHDGAVLVAVEGESIRFPWTTCGAEAAAELRQLRGLPLKPLRQQLDNAEKWRQCTHMYDLVELAIAHVAREAPSCLYEAAVEVLPERGAVEAELSRNFKPLLGWQLDSGVIVSPDPYSGISLQSLPRWGAANLEPPMLEAVLVLQRAVHVSFGKVYDWGYATTAGAMGLPPTCFTLDNSRSGRALAVKDHVRDFSDCPDAMLIDGIKRL